MIYSGRRRSSLIRLEIGILVMGFKTNGCIKISIGGTSCVLNTNAR